jgi:hypothetical protein
MSIQTALSVGDPVKNLDTSEVKEWMALNPVTMSTAARIKVWLVFADVFIMIFFRLLRLFAGQHLSSASPTRSHCLILSASV